MQWDEIGGEARKLSDELRQRFSPAEIACLAGAILCEAIGSAPLPDRMVLLGAHLNSIAACTKSFAK